MTFTISNTMRRNRLHEQAKLVDHRTCSTVHQKVNRTGC